MKATCLSWIFPLLLLALSGTACAPDGSLVGSTSTANTPLRTTGDNTNDIEFLSSGSCQAVVTTIENGRASKGFDVIYGPSCGAEKRREVLTASRISGQFFVRGLPENLEQEQQRRFARYTCAAFGQNGFRHITAHTLEELYERQRTVAEELGPNTLFTTPEECGRGIQEVVRPI